MDPNQEQPSAGGLPETGTQHTAPGDANQHVYSPEQTPPPSPKRGRWFRGILLGTNAFVLVPTAIMILTAPFLGPAAIVPALLLIALFPVLAVLLIADFVILTIFLVRRIIHKDYTRPWILVVAFVLWLGIASVAVPLVRGAANYIQDRRDQKLGQQLLSKDAAVGLVKECKIASFYQAGYGGSSPGDKAWLRYKDKGIEARLSTQHATDPKNYDALISAAEDAADRCGQPVYNCHLGEYFIGGDPAEDCKATQQPTVDQNTCQAVWTTSNKTAPTDQVALGTSVSDGRSTVKVAKVTPNPTVVGDAPEDGTQYVAVELSISGQATRSYSFVHFPSSYPACGIRGSTTVDNSSGYFSPIKDSLQPTKHVSIAGKQSITSASSISGQVYALYEVAPGDRGYVSWTDSQNVAHNLALQ